MQLKSRTDSMRNIETGSYGVQLDQAQAEFIERRINLLKEIVPINSTIKLQFEKRRRDFKGELRINTLKTHFFSVSWGGDPLETFFKLEKDIKQKINYWKKKRFSSRTYLQEVS